MTVEERNECMDRLDAITAELEAVADEIAGAQDEDDDEEVEHLKWYRFRLRVEKGHFLRRFPEVKHWAASHAKESEE